MQHDYPVVGQWSDEDNTFVVSLPDFPHCKTHGDSYQEAVKHGQEMIESLIDFYNDEQKPLPRPQLFSLNDLQAA
ncbi:MAG: type II toxin-antitoxin system HicB family antitoxin [Candidatus Kapaibacterium sp.]|nr:MAG: type II toxin-antitoxin system HicB family antitoxin [Candidatus Kapabacteria bacterium]